ncbi:hypothetical protein Hanom_Chr14g01246121 [Helianthus anomalus]
MIIFSLFSSQCPKTETIFLFLKRLSIEISFSNSSPVSYSQFNLRMAISIESPSPGS